ncbi:uncharacterized protein LOC115236970 [Formica exsecta]|uniref:uncharacterized protein LOC115236970 n=1 Tax=Formica exsecta TaxID=72781 RepID=UPI001143100B|nr:uncharacterized protein LOC115236970 [Formica exsecta]
MAIKNVRAAISPVLTILCLCGSGVFEYPQGQPRLYFSIFYNFISWLFHIFLVIKAKIFCQTYSKDEFDLPIAVTTSIIFGVLYMLVTVYYDKKFKSCLNRLSIVDETLEKLGTPKNYMKLRKQIIWLIIGWIVSIFFMDIIDSLWFFIHMAEYQIVIAVCGSLILNYSYHISVIYDLKYMILLGYMKTQFEHVNQHIQKLTELKKRQVRRAWATSTLSLMSRHMAGTETSNRIIWILMHIHRELCSITNQLNTIFGLQMLMQTIVFQLFTIQLIYEFYKYDLVTINDTSTYSAINFLNTYFWATVIIVKMIVFNYICEELCTKKFRTCLKRIAIVDDTLEQLGITTDYKKLYTRTICRHLHLELRKISSEINSVFGIQLTLKMGLYFGFIALCFRETFNAFPKSILDCIANITGNIMSTISYSIRDDEVRENISQFLLQTSQAPVKFYGLRLFQFGFEFFLRVYSNYLIMIYYNL